MSLNPNIERLCDEDLVRCAHDLNGSLIEEDSPLRALVISTQPAGQEEIRNFLFLALSLAPGIAWELAKRYKRELDHQQNPNVF